MKKQKKRAGKVKSAKSRRKGKRAQADERDADRVVGARLRRFRKKTGMTTTELAVKLGLSQAQVSRLETGKQGLRSHLITRAADALGIKPIQLYVDQEKASAVDVVKEPDAPYGPAVPDELKEALRFPKFKSFVLKSARVFAEDEEAFYRLNIALRKTKV